MKKILVILMMGLLCSTSVMGQTKKRNTTKKRKAKTERVMTEFEKQQKEEYLLHQLIWCEYYYNNGDYESAERHKKDYEEAKNKNYYVEFKNYEYSEKEKKEIERLGIDTSPHAHFYKDGFMVEVHFKSDGKAELGFNERSLMVQRKAIDCYYGKRVAEMWKKERKHLRYARWPNTKELIDEINEASGYNAKHANKRSDVEQFINEKIEDFIEQHQVEANNLTVPQKDEQPNSPLSETSQSNRRFYQQHKSDYTKRK